ncbi:MAG: hypothetical protein HYR55_15010 [Acidobacteria bacterium]|nr:hypothetical protein [Acidobacteriota bacterium]MBI3657048.1 hypothetical protein [Acidobacteriota bacterium]
MSRYFTWIVLGLAAFYVIVSMVPPRDPENQMHLQEFGAIPVVYQGRVKPFDTLVRNSLMMISGRQTYVDLAGSRQPAIEWLLDVMTSRLHPGGAAEKKKVFRIENDQVLNLLGLEARPGLLYAVEEFVGKIEDLEKEATRARKLESGRRDLFDKKVLEFAEKLMLHIQLADLAIPHAVPPQSPQGDWMTIIDKAHEAQQKGEDSPAVRSLLTILQAYAEGKTEQFNSEVARYRREFVRQMSEAHASGFEVFLTTSSRFTSAQYYTPSWASWLAWRGWVGHNR